ncbi:MAG: AbrB/MazE/SpoVT family DNA-binding domain-containing protein [Clostridia bacterium]|nr:AbrB/MazE/SpoVT family DNA-binding domain-containing protein [Clostridia bacterium]
MKSTGIVRKLDELGRLVLPKELRTTLDIKEKDPVEIFVEGDTIILKKYAPCCIFCKSTKDNLVHNGRHICKKCIDKLAKSV